VGGGDSIALGYNTVSHSYQVSPATPLNPLEPAPRADSIVLSFGLPDISAYGYYVNARRVLKSWSVVGNKLYQFVDGIRITKSDVCTSLDSATINGNWFNTTLRKDTGIWLEGPSAAPDSAFINYLTVDSNRFGCGFDPLLITTGLPSNAFVRPRLQ